MYGRRQKLSKPRKQILKRLLYKKRKKKIKDKIIRDNQIIFEKEEKEERKNNIMKD